MAELQPEPNPSCSPRGFSPLLQPCTTTGHSWGPRAQGGLGAIHQHSRVSGPGPGQPPPPGMNYRAINHAGLSGSGLCLPSIRRHKQLCSLQDWQEERQKWVHRDPGDLWGCPGQGGSAGHLCTCLHKAARLKNSNSKIKPQICQEELERFGSWVQGRLWQRCCRCSFAHLLICLISN